MPGGEPGGGGGGGGGPGGAALSHVASPSVARRLSQSELDNTIRDLLYDETAPATRLLIEDEYAPYDNDYTLQEASQALIEGLEAMATDVATRAMQDTARRDRIVGCTPTGPGDAECFRSFLERFLPRAFRRTVSAEEIAPYLTLLDFATEDNAYVDNDFYTAVDLAIRAVLQDPELLYRIEVGTPTRTSGVYALTGHEIATRMAYLIWGSTPDDELMMDAELGTLATPEGRERVARRMLEDERAKTQLHRFHAMWLGYRAIPHPPDLVAAFNSETTSLIDRVVFDEPQSYMQLFLSSETYLNGTLATHYSLPAPAGGEGWVAYPADGGRAGILSHGSVLAAFSKFTDTSPTQRGIFVRTRLMCQTIPPPPPTVDVDQPPGGEGDTACKEERYSMHRSVASCASCHDQIDPIGFGLENFDIGGRWREHDDGRPECVISGTGELPGYGEFSGPAELATRLVDSGVLDACAVQQFFTFAVGRDPYEQEMETVGALTEAFRGNDHRFVDLVVGLVTSERFALRAEEAL